MEGFSKSDLVGATECVHGERRVVRFQDVDAAGIVFYPRVLEYFSDVYVGLFAARGFDLPLSLRTDPLGIPLVHAEADYMGPLRFGDDIDVEVVAIRRGEASFRVGYRVRHVNGGVAAVGQTVHVCIDRTTFKPTAIPEAILHVIG